MRKMQTMPALLLLACPLAAQNPPIDMNLWTVEHINGSGPWTIDPGLQYAQSSNTVNTDCSVFYSEFDVTLLDFRITPTAAGGDDDMIGFVLGWQPGDSVNATADYILVDWKRNTQTYQDWGTATEGLAISRVTGAVTPGFGGGPIDLWSHTLNCTELLRSPDLRLDRMELRCRIPLPRDLHAGEHRHLAQRRARVQSGGPIHAGPLRLLSVLPEPRRLSVSDRGCRDAVRQWLRR